MESDWMQQIAEIELRARSVNLALSQLCVAAGVRQNNLTRWRQGRSPSLRVFSRDVTKLEATLRGLEFDMAIRLIGRINPVAAPRIAELLHASDAGDLSDFLLEAEPHPAEKADGPQARGDRGSGSCRAA